MPSTLSVVEAAPARAGQAAFAPSINDLAIRVGTVNGSGSQSANLVILRALYAMGIPCSGKNVFPSNIEGLPTWFHIRASAKGYVCHVLDPQVLVCMHEPTAKDDVSQLKPGAICIYRDDFDVDLTEVRDDVRFFPVPFQKLVEKAYPPDKTDKGYRGQAPQGHQHGLCGGAGLRVQDRDGGGRGGHPARVPRAQGQGGRDQHQRGADGLRVGGGEPPRRPPVPGPADGRCPARRS